jgi:hypothetical protein
VIFLSEFMPEAKPAGDRLNVFISYGRDDIDFVDQLDETLALGGFATSVDRHGISGGEESQVTLGGFVRNADTVVFLSPASAKSEVCTWEVEEAIRLNKRIIPVSCRPLDGVAPPKVLAQRTYIFFHHEPKSPGSGLGDGLRQLVAALNTDLDWPIEHTRLLQPEIEWEAGECSANPFLSVDDVAAAKTWVGQRPKDRPELADLHLALLRATKDEETTRIIAERRRLEEVVAAQEERQKAIEKREAAVNRAAALQYFLPTCMFEVIRLQG